MVIPLACGAGLVSAVKATSDESAQLGAVIVFSLMLRLHVHVLMPLLTRDDVEDVHMQCRVFTLQMVTCVAAASVAAVWEAPGPAMCGLTLTTFAVPRSQATVHGCTVE